MNKICLLITGTVICCAFNIHAQPFRGGLYAGLNTAQIDGDSFYGYNQPGLMAGAFVNTNILETFNLQMEIRFIGKGASNKLVMNTGEFHRVVLNYFEIPVMGRVRLNQHFIPEAGLAYAILIKAKEDPDGLGYGPPANPFSRDEFSWLIGCGYVVNDHLTFSARFQYSLFPISKIATGRTRILHGGQYNNCITLALMYQF